MVDEGNDMQGLEMEATTTNGEQENWYFDERIKRLLLDLQRHWLADYQKSREKSLVELAERVSANIRIIF